MTAPSILHLDTSFLIRALARGTSEDRLLRAWIEGDAQVGIGSIAWTEFLCGPVTASQVDLAERIVGPPTPFTEGDARVAARLFNDTGRRRGSLIDCMVAASAIGAGASVATSNPEDFTRFAAGGLRVIPPS